MPWVGLQCVIAVFPEHNHLLLGQEMTQGSYGFDNQNVADVKSVKSYLLRAFP